MTSYAAAAAQSECLLACVPESTRRTNSRCELLSLRTSSELLKEFKINFEYTLCNNIERSIHAKAACEGYKADRLTFKWHLKFKSYTNDGCGFDFRMRTYRWKSRGAQLGERGVGGSPQTALENVRKTLSWDAKGVHKGGYLDRARRRKRMRWRRRRWRWKKRRKLRKAVDGTHGRSARSIYFRQNSGSK